MNQPRPPQAARTPTPWLAAAVVCLLCLAAPAAARQQPDNSNARGGRTKRVTPLKTRDSQSGARVTITSDGALNDYSAYRSGDRFIVVIPQAEGGGGGAKGRGFEGAQVTRRGKDLVYTFKLEPGASARVNQRFNQLDVQFTAAKPATNANAAPTPAATPRATRTPPEIAGLPSPTPATRPTAEPRIVSEAAQAATTTQQPAATPNASDTSQAFPLYTATPAVAESPTAEPSVAPTVGAEQIAQAQTQQQQPAPGGAIAQQPADAAATATLGATLINNWPWIIAAMLALGLGLLFVGRRGARREQQEVLPPASMAVPALREKRSAPVASTATSATNTAANVSTPAATPVVAPPVVTTTAKAAPDAEPRGKKKKKKGKGKDAPQVTAAKVEPVDPVETVRAVAHEAVESKADEVDAAEAVAPALASVGPTLASVAAADEDEAAAVDSERVGDEVKNLLAGESYDESVMASKEAATRQLVAAELSAALTGRNEERKRRARAAFLAHGYFDDAARDLQSAEAPGRRAAAAQALSLVGDRAATAHLVAALEDPSADVRRAAVEALAELRDPAAVGPLEALRWREQSRQVPRQLIMRAVELCAEPVAEEADETETTLVRDEHAQAAPTAPAETVAGETFIEPSSEVAAPTVSESLVETVDESFVEQSRAETSAATFTPAEAFVESAAVDAVAAESRAAEAVEGGAVADEIESGESFEAGAVVESGAAESAVAESSGATVESAFAESTVVEPPAAESSAVGPSVSLAGEETPVVETEKAAGGEFVYTFDEDEAAAWAEHRSAPASETEEDLFAELDALEAQSRARAEAGARPTYVAPEFALREEPAAEDGPESGVDAEQAGFDEAMAAALTEPVAPAESVAPAAIAEQVAHDEETGGFAPAEPVGVAEAVSFETAEHEAAGQADTVKSIEQADTVKSVELFGEATPAAETVAAGSAFEADTVEEASFAIEPFRPEESRAETPFASSVSEVARPASEEVGLAPSLEETQPSARGLAAMDDADTVLDAARPEKGLSAALDEPGEISIIPKAIQLRLESDDSHERAQSVLALARLNTDEAFTQICTAFDDTAEEVREAAARALYEVSEDRAESFTRALREASADRRRNIGAALASSGLADEAVSQLTGESRDRTYDAFSLLFLMAKAGETAPLIRAIESHPDNEVRLAVVKLLALSGQQEVLPSFRRLAVRGSLPTDVRAAVMEAIYQISSSGTAKTPAATK